MNSTAEIVVTTVKAPMTESSSMSRIDVATSSTETNRPFCGTLWRDRRPNARGAMPLCERPYSMRDVENSPELQLDDAEVSTTKFMTVAAAASPARLNRLTNGDCPASILSQGVTVMMTSSART